MAFVVSLVSHSKHHLSLVSFGQLGPHRNLDLGSTRAEAECLGSEASTLSRTRVKVEATVGLVQVSISWAKSWAMLGYCGLRPPTRTASIQTDLSRLLATNGVRNAINYENILRMYKHVFELEPDKGDQ